MIVQSWTNVLSTLFTWHKSPDSSKGQFDIFSLVDLITQLPTSHSPEPFYLIILSGMTQLLKNRTTRGLIGKGLITVTLYIVT
jgi:hypothetical protein